MSQPTLTTPSRPAPIPTGHGICDALLAAHGVPDSDRARRIPGARRMARAAPEGSPLFDVERLSALRRGALRAEVVTAAGAVQAELLAPRPVCGTSSDGNCCGLPRGPGADRADSGDYARACQTLRIPV
jgi:hypothetical protein